MKIPFIGGAYEGRSRENNPQECINLFPAIDLADGKSNQYLAGCPGLIEYCDLPTVTGEASGPVYNLSEWNSILFAVMGARAFIIYDETTVSDLGAYATLTNLVPNGDMEDDDNWSPITGYGNASDQQYDGTKWEGTYSWQFITDGIGQGIQSDVFSLTAGTVYNFSFYVVPTNHDRMFAKIYDGDGSLLESYVIFDLVPNTWQKFTRQFTSLTSGAGAYVSFGVIGNATLGWSFEYKIDDVKIWAEGSNNNVVHLAANDSHMVVVIPGAGGFYKPKVGAISAISDGDFPTPRGLCYLDGYWIVTQENSAKWYISGLNDPSAWDALDFNTCQTGPGFLKTCIALKGQVCLLGEHMIEFHAHTGQSDWPFTRISSIDDGILADGSLVKYNESIFYLSRDRQVKQITNYNSSRISTDSIEYHLNSYSTINDAKSFIYTIEGHTFYQLNLPTEGKTWAFDLDTGLWHERRSFATGGGTSRHRGNCFATFQGVPMIGDYENGIIYKLSSAAYTDNGNSILKRRTSPVLHENGADIFYSSLEIDFEGGVGENLITNGTMEEDDNWSDTADPPVINRITAEKCRSGRYSRTFEVDDISQGIKSDVFDTVTASQYTITFWVYPATTTVQLTIRKGDNTGNVVDTSKTGLTSGDWNKVTHTWTETSGGSGAYVVFSSGALTSGIWYIDDVVISDDDNPPQAILDWSNDGGNTFGRQHSRSIGSAGQYSKRVIWNRLGKSRNRVFRLTIEDDVKVVIMGAELKALVGNR
jgi:hypothetical protein